MKPVVAIVGRPNVGKSTLFNKIVKERAAITEDTPGVTRDRLYRDAEWLDKKFLLVDTGGLEPDTDDFILSKVKMQAEVAMDEADCIVFVVDGRAGVTTVDTMIADTLRRKNKPVILTINKIDNTKEQDSQIYEFYGLGFDKMIAVSAEHTKNIGDLLDAVVENIREVEDKPEEEGLKIAIIGRPNVGKSSLVNKLLGEERVIVSNIAGTTRDAIDTAMTYNENKFVLIDTAGIRRKSKVEESLEYYSVLKAIKSIKRADVVCLMIDGVEKITEQDKKIAGLAFEEKKPVIIVMNKWDIVEKDTSTMKKYSEEAKNELIFLSFAPVMFVSAKTGQRVLTLLDKAVELNKEYHKRISTGLLNQVMREAILLHSPPTRKGKVVKINYITQAKEAPPKFILFANYPDSVHFSYLRYLENKIRESFGFDGVPIEFIINEKNE